METLFRRAEDIDTKIKSVKLPYLEWKLLFLLGNENSVDALADAAGTSNEDIQNALDVLSGKELVEAIAEDTPDEEAIAESAAEPVEEPAELSDEAEPTVDAADDIVQEEAGAEEMTAAIHELPVEKDVAEEEDIQPDEKNEAIIPEFEAASGDIEEEPMMEAEGEIEEESPEQEMATAEEDQADSSEAPEIEDISAEPEEQSAESEEQKDEGMTEFLKDISSISNDRDIDMGEMEEPASETELIEDSSEALMDMDMGEATETAESEQEVAEEPPATGKMEEIITDSRSKKIMVIDDSIVIRKMIEIALEDEDFKIVSVVSGKDGLNMLDEEHPDLVILDLMLPDMKGIDVLKTIKASSGIPVIMLSGKDSPQQIEEARNEGADEFLPKPFKDEDLVEKIKQYLSE